MKGTLAEGVLPGLLRSLYVGRKSGLLHFTQGETRRTVLFHHGQIVRGESNVLEERLGETMVRRGMLSTPDFDRVSAIIISQRKRLGVVLRELGLADEEKLQDALGVQIHEILLKVFSDPTGEFAFAEATGDGPAEGDNTPKVSTGELILEAVDRVRDPELIRRSLGDINRVLTHPSDPLLRFQKVTLTPTDGYILSRVDGVMSAREIIQMLGLPEEDVCRSLLGLLSTGLVEFRAGATRTPASAPKTAEPASRPAPAPAPPIPPPPAPQAPPAANAPPPRGPAAPVAPPAPPSPAKPAAAVAPPPAASAPGPTRVETTEERRKEILDAWSGIKTRTHYEVLGLPEGSTAAQVKDAYFRLAKRLHPDVHTDPALADLHDKLEAVFIRLGQAYQALKDVKPKAPIAPKATPSTPAAPSAPEPEPSAPPMDAQKIHEALYKAEKAYEADKYWDAIQLAEGALPHCEAPGVPAKHLSRARLILAKCFMKNPNWVRRAEEQLQLIMEKDPKNIEAIYLLATIYKAGGLKSRAISLLRRVLELNSEHTKATADLDALLAEQQPEPPAPSGGILKKFFGRS
jgi:hypothetical protein